MKNFTRSKKALSPVVASIILIAVTVAVSIAVAAWMGALTVGFMQTEELKITSVTFNGNTATVVVHNYGTDGVTINAVMVNDSPISAPAYTPDSTVEANTDVSINIIYANGFAVGSNYQFKIASAKGNSFMYSAVA
jgi:archaeal type IV pilus assembly protein PilA